jgi:glycosyltransferase involved in cell wall biosynthesis
MHLTTMPGHANRWRSFWSFRTVTRHSSAPTICFVTNELHPFTPGGIGRLLQQTARVLRQAGWEVVFLFDCDRIEPDRLRAGVRDQLAGAECITVEEILAGTLSADEDIPEWAFHFHGYWRSHRIALALSRLCQQRRLDGVEFPDYLGLGYVTLKWRRLWPTPFGGMRIWVRLHCTSALADAADDWSDYTRGGRQRYHMERYSLEHADAWVAPSSSVVDWYARHYDLARPTFVDPPVFERLGDGDSHPRTLSAPPWRILFYGRLQRLKGADTFVQAAVRLCETTSLPLVFDLIGADTDRSWKHGSVQREIEAMIPPDHRDRFHFHGRIEPSQLPVIVGECTLAVVPSRAETFCLAAHELNWLGIPLVLNDIPAFADYFTDGRDCRKFDGTATGLSQVIEDVLAHPQSLREWVWNGNEIHSDPVTLYRRVLSHTPLEESAVASRDGYHPLVSVVVPYYNMQAYIDQTLQSVLTSRYPNWEMLVVNDGSTQTEAIAKLAELRQYYAHDPRIRFLDKPNGGLGSARNFGIRAARGEFILSLDADDVIHPDYLRRAVTALQRNPELVGLSCFVNFFLDGEPPDRHCDYVIPYDLLPELIGLENRAGVAGSVFRRSLFDTAAEGTTPGGLTYAEHLFAYEDWDLWWQLAERDCRVETLPWILYRYRRRRDSMVNALGFRNHDYLLRRIAEMHPDLVRRMSLTWFSVCVTELVRLRQQTGELPGTNEDIASLLARLAGTESQLNALRNSLTWRVGHAIARRLPGQLLRRLVQRGRRLIAARRR